MIKIKSMCCSADVEDMFGITEEKEEKIYVFAVGVCSKCHAECECQIGPYVDKTKKK